MTAELSARRLKRSRVIGAVLLVLYLAFAATVVLSPQRIDGDAMGVYRVLYQLYGQGLPRWITYDVVQVCANVVLTAPIGLFLAMMLPRGLWWVAAVTCVALFAGVEAAQLLLPARVPSVLDWAANSLGGLVGSLVWLLVGSRDRGPRLY